MKLTVVITTKNEAANIAASIHSFDSAVARGEAEVIVVDNASSDDTKKIALELGAAVYDKGPERSAQRNLGWRMARGEWVMNREQLSPDEMREIDKLTKISLGLFYK